MVLLLFTDWKDYSYNSVFVIINCLTQMIYYKLVKVINNAPKLVERIINVVIQHFSLPNSIINKRRAISLSKF